MLVLFGVCLGGVEHQPAGAAPRETPARKITRLRAKAARVQAAIDRMHARVEVLVEDYNEVHEALARTRASRPGPAGRCWTPAVNCGRPGACSASGSG